MGLLSAIGGGISSAAGLLGQYFASKSLQENASQLNYNNQIKLYQEGPSAQVAGLRAAGLNPLLASSLGSTGSVTGVSGGSVSAPDSAAAARNIKELSILDAQKDKLAAEATSARNVGQAALDNAGANSVSAAASLENAKTNQWQIYDARTLGSAGFEVVGIGANAKGETINTIRINKVTGQVYNALTGDPIKVIRAVPLDNAKSIPGGEVKVTYDYREQPDTYKVHPNVQKKFKHH